MPIASEDILFKLSTKSGSAGNSEAQADPNASLGKYVSTTEITDATLNNLFDDISGDENADEDTEYRCFFVENSHESLPLLATKVWISEQVEGGADVTIGLDPSGVFYRGSSTPQATDVANEGTAPIGVSFSNPTTKGGGLSIGTLPASGVQAIWVKRTATNSAAKNNDGVTIRVEGDTTE